MSVFFNAYVMIGFLCYFLLTSAFLPDFPLRPAGAIQMTQKFFEFSCFLVTIRNFEGSEGFLAFVVPILGPKNLKHNFRNPPKVLRKASYQLAVFWPNF